MTEDHPVKYLTFEGKIPEGEYGAGEMRVWDTGTWKPQGRISPKKQIEGGQLSFTLKGDKLNGEFNLIELKGRQREGDTKGKQWLLIKGQDKYAKKDDELVPVLRGKTRTRPNRRERGPTVRKIEIEGTGKPARTVLKAKTRTGDVKLKVDKNLVPLTSLQRVYFPKHKYTKADLLEYYYDVSETILPYLKDRPLILKRFPLGVNGKFFFQHDVDEVPSFVETYSTTALGHNVDYVVCDNTATLLYLANMGVIPLHPWHSRVEDIDHPDWIVFDLDPGDVEFPLIRKLALATKACLDQLGLESYPKTSGSRGMHVYVPIENKYSYEYVAGIAERIAKLIVRENPDLATIVRQLAGRAPNHIYVDHLQNARGKTIVAPYSVREREGATVSAPLTWQEVKRDISPADFTIKNMPRRIKQKGDLFAPVLSNKQSLKKADKILTQLEKSRR